MSDLPDIIAHPEHMTTDAVWALKVAQAAVRAACGWHITPDVDLTGAVNTRGGRILRLPAQHITRVDAITDRDGNDLEFELDGATGLLELKGTPPVGINAVKYAIHAGYPQAPDVESVVIAVAKRALSATNGVIASQSVNGSSVSYNTARLFIEEERKLRPYKLGELP